MHICVNPEDDYGDVHCCKQQNKKLLRKRMPAYTYVSIWSSCTDTQARVLVYKAQTLASKCTSKLALYTTIRARTQSLTHTHTGEHTQQRTRDVKSVGAAMFN